MAVSGLTWVFGFPLYFLSSLIRKRTFNPQWTEHFVVIMVLGGGLTDLFQGAYNSEKPGKPGNLREFVNSGKVRENSGNLKFTQGLYQMCA